jgi:glutaredoxin
MPSPLVRLYARPDCHLCDVARSELESLRSGGLHFEVEEVDIESDDELLSRYLERIPVIELNGQVIGELGLDADSLRARIDTL